MGRVAFCGLVAGMVCLGAEAFEWQNPLRFEYAEGQTAPRTEVRDPCIIREDGRYYMVFTMWPFRNREERHLQEPNQGGSPGIAMYSSGDLQTWRFENWLVKADRLPEDCPYKNRFWAPEVHKINGKFYLVFTADNWIKGAYNKPGTWGAAGYAFVGVSDKVTGPYEHITWIEGGPCDMSLFGDDDGKVYAVSPKYNVYVRQIDLSGLPEGKVVWAGEEVLAVACKNDDVALADDPDYLEGPWMEKIGGRYCLFHAAIYKYPGTGKAHEYWTQVAYADTPLGPWKKDAALRVFKGGHLAVFEGPDGKPWYCYRHEDGARGVHGRPCIDPVAFNPDGTVTLQKPSTEARSLRGAVEWIAMAPPVERPPKKVVLRASRDYNAPGGVPIRKLMDVGLRDPNIFTAPDGYHYMVGTAEGSTIPEPYKGDPKANFWITNEGIPLWRSRDLVKWETMGYVWQFERDGTWNKAFQPHKEHGKIRAIWAPEMHYLKGTYWICYSMNTFAMGILKSVSGKPEGPYVDIKKDGTLVEKDIDGSLFEDADGKAYFLYAGYMIARLADGIEGGAGGEAAPIGFPASAALGGGHRGHPQGRPLHLVQRGQFGFGQGRQGGQNV